MKEKILRKRLVSEGPPKTDGWYHTDKGLLCFRTTDPYFFRDLNCTYWYEEETAHVLSDEELHEKMADFAKFLADSDLNFYAALKKGESVYNMYLTTKQDEPIR